MPGRPRIVSRLALLALCVILWLLPDLAARLDRRPDEAWARVQSTGVTRFATEASYHPFAGLGSDGVFYGLDIDLAREVARRIGVRAEFIAVGIDGLYDVLRVGQADASISALPIDPARNGLWAYSRPYFDAGLVLVTREQTWPQSLDDWAGRMVGVALGSDGDAWLRFQQRRIAGIGSRQFDSGDDAVQAVNDGQVDAAIIDGVTARQALAAQPGDLLIVSQLTTEPYAVAVWGESRDLLAAIDDALESMARDGTLDRIVDEWMKR
jgi:polar amino acid transport system substrate-binding protein